MAVTVSVSEVYKTCVVATETHSLPSNTYPAIHSQVLAAALYCIFFLPLHLFPHQEQKFCFATQRPNGTVQPIFAVPLKLRQASPPSLQQATIMPLYPQPGSHARVPQLGKSSQLPPLVPPEEDDPELEPLQEPFFKHSWLQHPSEHRYSSGSHLLL